MKFFAPRQPKVERLAGGTLIRDARALDHRCRPPGCVEFAGDWKVTDTTRFPQDSVWLCNCGHYWISTFHHGPYDRRGLWLEWRYAYPHELRKLGIDRSDSIDTK